MTVGIFCHRDEDFVEVLLEAVELECRNIGFSRGRDTWLIAPIWIHVKAQPTHFPTCLQNLINESLVVAEAVVGVVAPTPTLSLFVEPRRIGLTESMQCDGCTILAAKVTSIDVQRRQIGVLAIKRIGQQYRQKNDDGKIKMLHPVTFFEKGVCTTDTIVTMPYSVHTPIILFDNSGIPRRGIPII